MKYLVRLSLTLALSACALGLNPSRLPAQEKMPLQNRPVPEKLSALLDDETLCVVHVDFTQIDTDAVLDNTRAFVEKLFDKVGLTEADRDSLRASLEPPGGETPLNWNLSKVLAKTGKAYLVDSLGVREAFLVVQTGGKSFPALVWAAIPKQEKLNVSLLTAALKDKSFLVRETDDFCFIAMLNTTLSRRANPANIGPNHTAARPEFLEAHQVVKDYPVQVLIAPPKYVKKVFRETRPALPGAFEKIDIASVPDALRFKAIGVNPEKMEFLVVAEAESENDAQMLYLSGSELFSRASAELVSSLRKYKETPREKTTVVRDTPRQPILIPGKSPDDLLAILLGAYPEIINEEYLKQLGQFLIPKPEGKRFVVRGNADTLQKVVDRGGPAIFAVIQKVIESEQNRRRSMSVRNSLKEIGLALHNYVDVHKMFSPPYSVDENGKPLHSWRVLILWQLDQDGLAQKIRLNEPWDSPYNKQFHNQMPKVYYNAAYPGSDKKGETNFCMVVGPETFGQANGTGLKIRDIKDGTSRTIMLVERKTPVCWMAPVDIEQEKAYLGINRDPAGIGGKTLGGIFATYADGSVRFLEQDMPREKLKANLTIAGRDFP